MINDNKQLNYRDYPDVLSISETAELLGIGVKTVRKLIHNGTIPAIQLGRTYKVPKTMLRQTIEKGAKKRQRKAM